jgi:hypothetical protein
MTIASTSLAKIPEMLDSNECTGINYLLSGFSLYMTHEHYIQVYIFINTPLSRMAYVIFNSKVHSFFSISVDWVGADSLVVRASVAAAGGAGSSGVAGRSTSAGGSTSMAELSVSATAGADTVASGLFVSVGVAWIVEDSAGGCTACEASGQ